MSRTKATTLEIGSISTGSLRVQDVLPAVLDALGDLRLSRYERGQVLKIQGHWDRAPDDLDNPCQCGRCSGVKGNGDSARWCLELDLNEILFDIVNAHCPDYCYFGSHPGDGADFGVWPCEEVLEPGPQGGYDGLVYRSTRYCNGPGEPVPPEYTHFLAANDHGNATLYRRAGTRWVECWSIV